MKRIADAADEQRDRDRFLFTCGLAGLASIVLFTISNFALGDWQPPKPSASPAEIARFYLAHGAKLEWAVGMRYAVFLLLPTFLYGVALYVRDRDPIAQALSQVALIGVAWLVATGMIANTLEAMLIFAKGDLASQPEFAHLSSLGSNALFGVAVLPHALVIGSLSEAGRRTSTLPMALVVLGYFQAITGVLGAVALGQALRQGLFFDLTFGLSFFAFALWYLGAAVTLVLATRRAAGRLQTTRDGDGGRAQDAAA
jgi:hypothetical protein